MCRQSDGCRRALRASSSRPLRRPRVLPGWVARPRRTIPGASAPGRLLVDPRCVRLWFQPTAAACTSCLPLGSSFPLVSSGATLDKAFFSPRPCADAVAREAAGWAGAGGAARFWLRFCSPPSPTLPARGPFWRSPGGARGNGPFPVVVGRARAGGRRREAGVGGMRAGRAPAEGVPGATCPPPR